MNECEEPIRMQFSLDDVLSKLTSEAIFSPELVEQMLAEQQLSGRNEYAFENMHALLMSQLFFDTFKEQWRSESNTGKWKKREPKIIIIETVLHTITNLSIDVENARQGYCRNELRDLPIPPEDVGKELKFLSAYFTSVFHRVEVVENASESLPVE